MRRRRKLDPENPLARAMFEAGLTQTELAALCGVSASTIGRILDGSEPGIRLVYKIVDAINASLGTKGKPQMDIRQIFPPG